ESSRALKLFIVSGIVFCSLFVFPCAARLMSLKLPDIITALSVLLIIILYQLSEIFCIPALGHQFIQFCCAIVWQSDLTMIIILSDLVVQLPAPSAWRYYFSGFIVSYDHT